MKVEAIPDIRPPPAPAAEPAASPKTAEPRPRAEAAPTPPREPSLVLASGFAAGTFKATVDLVDPTTKRTLFRVFGPPDRAVESYGPGKPAAPPPTVIRSV